MVRTAFASALVALAFAAARASAGDGVFEAQVTLNHDSRRGMTEIVREFNVCFDPKGKDRKFDIEVKIVAGDLTPQPDVVSVTCDGKTESSQKVTWEAAPQGPNKDEKADACYRLKHRLNVPLGGLKPGTKCVMSIQVLQFKKKKLPATAQGKLTVSAVMGG